MAEQQQSEFLTLGELANLVATRGESALGQLYAQDPVLVIRLTDDEEEGLFNTPQRTYKVDPALAETKVGEGTTVMHRGTLRETVTLPTSRVVPVRKSDRNPFAGLITIGRARNNDLRLRSGQLSKMHGWFQEKPEGWRIKDHNSTNGTFVNGERVEKGSEAPIRSGDTLSLGDVEAMFLDADGLAALCGMLLDD